MAERKLKVFLCHSSGDKPAVRDLYRRLCEDGVEPWLDEEDLLPGQEWEQEIPQAVRVADAILVCLSQDSINKRGVVRGGAFWHDQGDARCAARDEDFPLARAGSWGVSGGWAPKTLNSATLDSDTLRGPGA